MLHITIPKQESWDEERQEFVSLDRECHLQLEHSLVSLSKWEAKWQKPFLTKQEKGFEETIDYIRCMTLTQNVDPAVYDYLTNENINQINNYIAAPMTATFFSKQQQHRASGNEQITSELVYYWMVALTIPFECQKWHLNRLLTLIKVCNIKNTPPKKHKQRDLMSRNASLNAARRKELNTRG